MEKSVEHMEITVPQRRALCIQDGRGSCLRVIEGCLWVTQELDTADVVLGAGDTFELDRPGVAVAYAFRAARLAVVGARRESAFSLSPGDGYREYAKSVWRSMMAQLWSNVRNRFAPKLERIPARGTARA